jgi:hypothetical protein
MSNLTVMADPPDEERTPMYLLRLALTKLREEEAREPWTRHRALATTCLEETILWLLADDLV